MEVHRTDSLTVFIRRDGEDGAVEDVDGDGAGLGGLRLTLVHSRVVVVDVANDEAGDGAAAGVAGQRPLRRLAAVELHDLKKWEVSVFPIRYL